MPLTHALQSPQVHLSWQVCSDCEELVAESSVVLLVVVVDEEPAPPPLAATFSEPEAIDRLSAEQSDSVPQLLKHAVQKTSVTPVFTPLT